MNPTLRRAMAEAEAIMLLSMFCCGMEAITEGDFAWAKYCLDYALMIGEGPWVRWKEA